MDAADVGQVRDELWRLYEEWFAAIGATDPSFFEATLSDDWVYVDHSGVVRGKDEYLEYIRPVLSDEPLNTLKELSVRLLHGVVIVHGRYLIEAEYAPPGGGDTRFTAIWMHRDGGWRAMAHHSTTVAAPSS